MSAITRFDLEQNRSRTEMEALIEIFHDPAHFPNHAIYRLKGIEKTMLDEYIPLYRLLVHLSGTAARLLADSNCGPDGIVTLPNGYELHVQITTSHRDSGEGLGRRILSNRKPYWPEMKRTEHRSENGERIVGEEGRAFTTPLARAAKVVHGVENALRKKIDGFKSGTDALLISGEMSLVPESWKDGVRAVLDSVRPNPYSRVFVGDTRGIYID